jgi:hypothetical protein
MCPFAAASDNGVWLWASVLSKSYPFSNQPCTSSNSPSKAASHIFFWLRLINFTPHASAISASGPPCTLVFDATTFNTPMRAIVRGTRLCGCSTEAALTTTNRNPSLVSNFSGAGSPNAGRNNGVQNSGVLTTNGERCNKALGK